MVDWKRTKELKYKSYGYKRGYGPCARIQDCNYNHYTLQLNMYKYLLETHYDIFVDDMHLVVLYPENDSYIKVPIDNVQHVVRDIVGECATRGNAMLRIAPPHPLLGVEGEAAQSAVSPWRTPTPPTPTARRRPVSSCRGQRGDGAQASYARRRSASAVSPCK